MKALIVYCHPFPDSYNAAVRDRVIKGITEAGGEVKVRDLYAAGFSPVLTREEWQSHVDPDENFDKIAEDGALIKWCDTIVFVYPTWWYAMPAMLKGWLDRVMVPGLAFHMPEAGRANIRPGLTHIKRITVFTTCGATRWLSALIGWPGRKILLRGVRVLCHPRCKTTYVAIYDMNHATPLRLRAHLDRVETVARRMTGSGGRT